MNLQQKSLLPCICGFIFALGATGCAATGMVQTAQTVGKGGYEVSIDPGVNGVLGLPFAGPAFHAAFRYGVTDRIDIGARVGTTLAELQAKFLFTDPANETIAVSIVPAAGVLLIPGSGFVSGVNIPIPVLIGFKFGAHELTLGPRFQNSIYFDPTGTVDGSFYSLGAGLSLGFAAQATESFRILPEFSVVTPIVIGGSDGQGNSEYLPVDFGLFSFSFNLGLQFGSARKKFTAKPAE